MMEADETLMMEADETLMNASMEEVEAIREENACEGTTESMVVPNVALSDPSRPASSLGHQALEAQQSTNPTSNTEKTATHDSFVAKENSDDEMAEEVFVDEPIDAEPAAAKTAKSSKRGRRNRSKAAAGVPSFQSSPQTLTPRMSNQKSYWSSDDDSFLGTKRKFAARVNKRGENNIGAGKTMTDPVSVPIPSPQQAPPRPRPKKSRSKRRLRRKQDDDEGESSTSDEEALQPQQRMTPPLPTTKARAPSPLTKNSISPAIDEKPPPVAVVRTTKPKPSPKVLKTSVSANLHSSSSNINSSHHTGTTAAKTPSGKGTGGGAPPRVVGLSPQVQHLSFEDMEICQRLDDEYENALEEREIGYMARYTSVRQSACFSVVFMLSFMALGTTFFMRYADWSIHDSLLFSIYTVTTVGYGNQSIPKESGFQFFTILYIFVGIATLTIMVAQVYQCIALEASRAQHSRDKTEMARRGLDIASRPGFRGQNRLSPQTNSVQSSQASASSSMTGDDAAIFVWEDWAFVDTLLRYYEQAKHFFTYNEYGRSFSVLLPFAGLILVGAVVVGPIEGWNVVESLYFAVVSLTTVGFGDYYPKHVASIWFCILWLPFSIGFMSMFLKNVATFYIRLSAQNINRIERRMRRRLAQAKERFQLERAEALKRAYQGQARAAELELNGMPSAQDSEDSLDPSRSKKISHTGSSGPPPRRRGRHKNFDAVPTNSEDASVSTPPVTRSRSSLFGSPEETSAGNRRERILKNSLEGSHEDYRPKGQTMDTMKDVIKAVHKSIDSGGSNSRYMSVQSSVMKLPLDGQNDAPMRKPSFALRALVQERFAEIIATDIAGFQSSIEIKDNTLSVTIDSLKETADKWLLPRRARKAFRAVAFEALYFVGEHGLITRGADALYDLTPFEFHGLFNPLLAAMGDADTMVAWLANTDMLAEVDLRNKDAECPLPGDEETGDGACDGSRRSHNPSTSEKLHTATHKIRTEGSPSIDRIHAGNAFS